MISQDPKYVLETEEICRKLLDALDGRTLATAESCTGGGIGQAITMIPGSSKVYKGGIISYVNEIKRDLLHVPASMLETKGAVSADVAMAMAYGARNALGTDMAISVTGLAGPGVDEFGNQVGTVYIGIADWDGVKVYKRLFTGDRAQVREETILAALTLALERVRWLEANGFYPQEERG